MAEQDEAPVLEPDETPESAEPDERAEPETDVEPDASAEPETDAEPKAKRRFPWLTLIALVIIGLLVLPVFSTLQPAYYERYPSLRPRMEHWRTSTHARIPCSACHVEPGVVGFATFAVRSIPAFYSQLLTGPKSTNLLQVPDKRACQKCHTAYRQVSVNGDLLIPHRAHVEVLGIQCATCHKNLVHYPNAQGFNKPEMATCLNTCHDGKQATNECQKCHTQKQVPDSHKSKDWLTIHPEMTETVNCGKCHAWQPDYCRECHKKRPPSHVGNWKTDHAARAKARGTKGCLFCHGETFCKKCH